jgi:hypothetical protein
MGAHDNTFGNERSRILVPDQQIRMMPERPVDLAGIGIDQQLAGIEPMSLHFIPGTFSSEPVTRAYSGATHETIIHIAQPLWQREAVKLSFSGFIEYAEEYLYGVPGDHCNIESVAANRDSERRRRTFGFR